MGITPAEKVLALNRRNRASSPLGATRRLLGGAACFRATHSRTVGYLVFLAVLMTGIPIFAEQISLEQALDRAVNRTSRGSIIRGNAEVASETYQARRVSFYVPEIRLEGSLPSYDSREQYGFFYGGNGKQLSRSSTFGLISSLRARQNLLTGGTLDIVGHLLRNEDEYPRFLESGTVIVDELTREGKVQFTLSQPILKPSVAKNDLDNKRDDLALAELTRQREIGTLKKEVVDAYFDVLQSEVDYENAAALYESAALQAGVDSAKRADQVISEEQVLESTAKKLDAELAKVDKENVRAQRRRELASLLEIEAAEITLAEPPVPTSWQSPYVPGDPIWERSSTVRTADLNYRKAARSARYAASGHGVSADLNADYQAGVNRISSGDNRDKLNSNTWNVALNFTLPLWDGGASSAAVKAARLGAESSRLEAERVRKSAQAELEALLNALSVGSRKLQVMDQQISVLRNRLAIAERRMNNGEISRITYLASLTALLEARSRYLAEFKTFNANQVDLAARVPEA